MFTHVRHFAQLVLAMGLSFSAQALTLAGIDVQSHKGEPLRADVIVMNATPEEWGQLRVKIAPSERFAQLGLVFTPSVGQLQVELFEAKDGSQRIRLVSAQNFSDNFVDLLIEAQTGSSKWVKAYTLMLKALPAQAEAPMQLPAVASSALSAPPAAASEHVVQKGESASQIIQKWLTEDMSTQQMLVALLKNQPEAFIEGNVNLLRAGAVLKAPSTTAVKAIDPEQARQFLVAQQKEFIAYSQAASLSPQFVKGQAPAKQIIGKVGQAEPVPTGSAESIDQLKLTQARVEKQNEETRLAAQRALQDAQKQLDALQSHVNQLVQLTSSNTQSIQQTTKQKAEVSAAGTGWLNLQQLLESPHKNSYLWAALTLLGILTLGAGLRIQGRKSTLAFSTLKPTLPETSLNVSSSFASQKELPADIAALNLDLSASTPPSGADFGSPASAKTLQ